MSGAQYQADDNRPTITIGPVATFGLYSINVRTARYSNVYPMRAHGEYSEKSGHAALLSLASPVADPVCGRSPL